MWYSILDIQLPIAQKICRNDYFEFLRECDPITGWLPAVRNYYLVFSIKNENFQAQLNAIRAALKADVNLTSTRLGNSAIVGGGGGGNEEEDDEIVEDDLEFSDDEDINNFQK